MKHLLLTLSMVALLAVPSFSQLNKQFKTDPIAKNFFDYQESKFPDNKYFKESLPFSANILRSNSFQTSENLQTLNNDISPKADFNMPVHTPIGSFPMKIHEPDSAMDYKMLIKEFQVPY